MKYSFKIRDWDKIKIYSIKSDDPTISNMGSWGWTPTKAQEIIDGVNESTTKPKGEEYVWANEDVTLYSNQNGVFLLDTMAIRAKETDQSKLWLRLTHSEFITFMTDFKKFIEDNS